MADDPDLKLIAGIDIDDAALAKMTAVISRAIGAGFKGVEKTFGASMVKNLTDALKKAEAPMRNQAKSFDEAGASARKYGSTLTSLEKQIVDFGAEVRDSVKDSATVIAKSVEQAGIGQRQVLQEQLFERLQAERKGASLAAIETQRAAQSQIIAQRQSGQQRIQLTRSVLETIGRLEKGLGAAIAGIARTATAAVSKTLSGMGSLFRRGNVDITQGLDSALGKRESLFRSSFRRQDAIISQSVRRQERELTRLRQVTSKGVLGGITGRGIGSGIAGLGVGVALAAQLRTGYTDAINFGEQVNKNTVVFGAFAEEVISFADDAPNKLGVTRAAVLEATGTFGNLFRALRLSEEDSADFSLSLTTLASDIASFGNIPVEEAFTALRAGLVGESEPLRRFGIDVTDARLRAEAFLLGISDGNSVLTAGQKAQAAYSAIMKDSVLAQGDFARTAQDGANAAKRAGSAITEMASLVMARFIPAITFVNNRIVRFSQTFSALIEGEVSPALKTLQRALVGAAAGLGTVLAARGAVEVFQLLGISLKLLLTPLGSVLAIAALVGAGIVVMSERSDALRNSLQVLGGRIRDVAVDILNRLKPAFDALAAFIDGTVIPAIDRAADWIGENLNAGIDSAIRFIETRAIPGFMSFARFLANTLAPIVATVATTIATAFAAVIGAVRRFVDFATPYLLPAIEGFEALGRAIRAAFSGGFGELGSGLGALAAGIGGTVRLVADSVVTALAPLGRRTLDFLRDLFSIENLKDVAKGFLGVVEEVGRILGLIVSDPRLLAALAAIAGSAAVIALTFAKGFVEGLLVNIVKLLGAASELLTKALATAIADPKILGLAIAAIFTVATVLGPLIAAFGSLGRQSAGAFTKSFGAAVASTRQYQNALFGGPVSAGVARDRRAYPAMREDARALTAQIRALGGEMAVLPIANRKSTEGLVAGRLELKRLSEGLTATEINALRFRDSARQAFGAVRTAASGAAGGIGMIGRAISESFDRSRFSQVMNGIVADARQFLNFGGPRAEEFRGRGAAAGEAFTGGMRAQLRAGVQQVGSSIVEGFRGLQNAARDSGVEIGKNVAAGLALGLGGFVAGRAEGQAGGSGIISALGAGLGAAALGASGPVALAVGGVALLGAEMGRTQRAATDAKKRIEQFSDVIRGDLTEAAKNGARELKDFADAANLLAPNTGQDVWRILSANLDQYKGTLNEAGVSLDDIIKAFQKGGGAVDELTEGMMRFDRSRDATRANTAADAIRKQYEELGAAVRDAGEAIRFESTQRPDMQIGGFGIDQATRSTASALQADIQARRQYQDAMDAYARSTLEAGAAQRQLDADTARSDAIDAYYTKLGELEAQAERTNIAIAEALGVRDPAGFEATVDQAILSLRGAFADIKFGSDDLFDQAELDTALATFREQLSTGAQAAFEEGVLAQDLDTALLPLLASVLDGVDDQGLRDTLTAAFEEGVSGAALVISQEQFDQLAAGLNEDFVAADLQVPISLDASEVRSGVDALEGPLIDDMTRIGRFGSSGLARGINAGRSAVVTAATNVAKAAVVAMEDWLGIESPSKVMAEVGLFSSQGFAVGISSGADAVGVAARSLGAALVDGVGGTAEAGESIGRSIGQAIVDGVADEVDDIASVASRAVEEALAATLFGGDQKQRGANAATASLFAQLTGSDSPFASFFGGTGGRNNALAGITDARSSFLSTFDSNASRIFDVNAKKLDELTASEREVAGENLFSLNPVDFFGASNLQSLTGAFDSILDFGEELIRQGVSVDEVVGSVKAQSDELITLIANLGFSRDGVTALAESLGLSDVALQDFLAKVRDLQANLSNDPTPRPPEDDPADAQQVSDTLQQLQRPIINYIYLPSGDATANALAVSNQQAYAARLP